MERVCKKHGLHNRWRLRHPPSKRKAGKSPYYRCSICIKEKEKIRLRRRNYETILKHAGREDAEKYRLSPNSKVKDFIYRGKGGIMSRKEFNRLDREKQKKLLRLGAFRWRCFLASPTCDVCSKQHSNVSFFDIHHKNGRETVNANRSENLLILCPDCHREEHIKCKTA